MQASSIISRLDAFFDLQVRSSHTLVVYSANFVDETVYLEGKPMVQHNGLALEFQTVPDAIHSDQAEKVILRAGQVFTSKTSYHAIAKK